MGLSLLFFLACGQVEGDDAGECSDGADNDLDGQFDCDDEGCFSSPDCSTEGDADTDADADGDTDADADGDTDADTDSDADTDTGLPPGTWCDDADADGFGDPSACDEYQNQPSGTVANNDDCDDRYDDVYPGAPETCDQDPIKDYNCDGKGGFEDGAGAGYSACDDCDDTNADAHPANAEGFPREDCATVGVDDNCDGYIDELPDATSGESINGATTYKVDADGDGHGDVNDTEHQYCNHNVPSGYVKGDIKDCDDGNAEINPDAAEDCGNSQDENCDEKWDYQDSTCEGGGYGSLVITLQGTYDGESPTGTASDGDVWVDGSGSCSSKCSASFVGGCAHQCTLYEGDLVVFPATDKVSDSKGGKVFGRAACPAGSVTMEIGLRQTKDGSSYDIGGSTSVWTSETALLYEYSALSYTSSYYAEVVVEVQGAGSCVFDGFNFQEE